MPSASPARTRLSTRLVTCAIFPSRVAMGACLSSGLYGFQTPDLALKPLVVFLAVLHAELGVEEVFFLLGLFVEGLLCEHAGLFELLFELVALVGAVGDKDVVLAPLLGHVGELGLDVAKAAGEHAEV